MEYKAVITIPVYNTNDEIRWLADVHIGSRIAFHFEGDRTELRNSKNKTLLVDSYNEDAFWASMDQIESSMDRIESWKYKLDVKKAIDFGPMFSWYVHDIKIQSKRENEGTKAIIHMPYRVSMEIVYQSDPKASSKYTEMKEHLENELVELYFANEGVSIKKDISIPNLVEGETFWRRHVIGKMIFALKGNCTFEDVDALTLSKERIIKDNYPWINEVEFLSQLMEPNEDAIIEDVTYKFPREETWADVMKMMGTFDSKEEDTDRRIRICMDNIRSTIRFMMDDASFRRDIYNALKVFDVDADQAILLERLSDCLCKMVFAHELGHMTFRSLRSELNVREQESLANWFSCLFADSFERNLVASLVPYQGEEYQDFITIPEKYKLKKSQYQKYCDIFKGLLRSW